MKFTLLVLSVAGAMAIYPTLAQSAAENVPKSFDFEHIQLLAAQAASSNAAAEPFVVTGLGIVKDTRTGLEWMRCSLGLNWNQRTQTCDGDSPKRYSWEQVQPAAQALNMNGGYATHADWRVPTIHELQSLRFCSQGFRDAAMIDISDDQSKIQAACNYERDRPAISQIIFTDIPDGGLSVWSSSISMLFPDFAWCVLFNSGTVIGAKQKEEFTVRLVR